MKHSFFETPHCQTLLHCKACRTSLDWRTSISQVFDVPDTNFECPHGYTDEDLPEQEEVESVQSLSPAPQVGVQNPLFEEMNPHVAKRGCKSCRGL